jgi:hypothetical protein
MPQNNSANNNFNSKNMDQLIEILAAKAGIPKSQLAADVAAGKFDAALDSMNPSQRALFNQLLQNPGLVRTFLSNPQAQSLYRRFGG